MTENAPTDGYGLGIPSTIFEIIQFGFKYISANIHILWI